MSHLQCCNFDLDSLRPRAAVTHARHTMTNHVAWSMSATASLETFLTRRSLQTSHPNVLSRHAAQLGHGFFATAVGFWNGSWEGRVENLAIQQSHCSTRCIYSASGSCVTRPNNSANLAPLQKSSDVAWSLPMFSGWLVSPLERRHVCGLLGCLSWNQLNRSFIEFLLQR